MEEKPAEGEKLEKGDVIRIEYELYIVSPDGKEELFDTTSDELAKKENIHDEKKVYESIPLIVGYDRTFKGLDSSLLSAKVGGENDVVLPPADGAGERKRDLIETFSIREFMRDYKDEEPRVGMDILRKGKRGTITGVAAGRIRVDFNHPLAGKTLKYKYKIVKRAGTLDEKVKDIIHMDYGMKEDFVVSINDNEAEILMPDVCKYDPNWAPAKFKIVSDLRDIIKLEKIRFVEEYLKKEEEKKEEAEKEEKVEKEEKEAEEEPKKEEEIKEVEEKKTEGTGEEKKEENKD